MAIFGSKKKTEQVKAPARATEAPRGFAGYLTHPRVTEKASVLSAKNVYTFDIRSTANKKDIAKAVKELYKVNPLKIRIARVASKKVFVGGKFGTKVGGKKAYIYLKKGDKIEIA